MALRVRTKGSFTSGSIQRVYYIKDLATGATTYTPSLNWTQTRPDLHGEIKTMRDYATPNFRRKQAEGAIISSPMSWDREFRSGSCTGLLAEVTDPGWYQRDQFIGDFVEYQYGLPVVKDVDNELVNYLRMVASTSAIGGVAAPDFQGQVFAAELSKTLRMLRSPLKGLRQYISDSTKWEKAKRPKGLKGTSYYEGRSRTAKESLKEGATAASQSWLEARFGWRPFLMEMDAALEAVRKGLDSERQTSRAKQERSITSTEQVKLSRSKFITDVLLQHETKVTVRAGILYDYRMDVASQWGLRWSDIPATAWELIPFSFVADWFFQVGDFIQALTPRVGTRYLAEFETTRISRSVTRTVLAAEYTGWRVMQAPVGSHTRTIETFWRVPKVSQPGIAFDYDIAHALRNGRAADLVALITQIFPSDKKIRR